MMKIFVFLLLGITFGAFGQTKFTQTGMASYYGGKFHGRKTASGEIFDTKKMTAAHRTLKFGTMVKVTHLKTNKSVIVRINDRGPFAHSRIIDVSQAAAQELGMMLSGTAKVRIEVVGENGKITEPENPNNNPKKDSIPTQVSSNNPVTNKPEEPKKNITDTSFVTGNTYSMWGTKRTPKGFGIQVGSYGDLDNAKELCKSLQQAGIQEVYIQVGWSEKRIYRVLAGAFEDGQSAEKYLPTIKKAGFDGYVKKHFD
jgi:rare lipoprotein A